MGNDQAFIEIYPEMVQFVNPSMAIVAGPTAPGNPDWGDPVVHVGHGLVVGTGGTARAGVVTWVYDEHPLPLVGGTTIPTGMAGPERSALGTRARA